MIFSNAELDCEGEKTDWNSHVTVEEKTARNLNSHSWCVGLEGKNCKTGDQQPLPSALILL